MSGNSLKKSLGIFFLAFLFFLIPIILILCYFARRWFLPAASAHAPGVDIVLDYTMLVVGFFLTAGHFFLAYVIVKFGGKEIVTRRSFSLKFEAAWAFGIGILMALLAEGGALFLAMPTWAKLYDSTVSPEATVVEVTGQQFQWNFRYPGSDGVFGRTELKLINDSNPLGIIFSDPASKDDIVVQDEMALPVGEPAHLYLRSKDVIHSLDLPNFRIRQDAVPGMVISVSFTPTRIGTYEIACSQICGLGHYTMRGTIKVMSRQKFKAWLSGKEKETYHG